MWVKGKQKVRINKHWRRGKELGVEESICLKPKCNSENFFSKNKKKT